MLLSKFFSRTDPLNNQYLALLSDLTNLLNRAQEGFQG
jgi:hypothetical protein